MRSPTPVRVRRGTLILPTYMPAAPDRNPLFLERRVYQGSSGRVYPLPVIDRIAEKPAPRAWQCVFLENPWLRVEVLPELGGRVHSLRDKTNGYDLIYRQEVIKPALVGLAGPWVSGGIEFNWPQHHRPATFMPVDTWIERGADGSVTVWCGDHDPMVRMKGMHGVCLRPDRACLELRVRVFNRTALEQTFLWWANVATRVHEDYQSFFPPDVICVADHARRSMSAYPLATGRYYGVDYGTRARKGVPASEAPAGFRPPRDAAGAPRYAANDISFYANIPVPTSYMCMGSREDFFGGYDHRRQAGLVHVANHRIAPGKKQWTWGNHAFGYAWDRNLTDPDARGECGPYIELMAGVYTDNQPDFSFLGPGETRSWSQDWYPIHRIGPVHQANRDAAVTLNVSAPPRRARLGVCVTARFAGAGIELRVRDRVVFRARRALAPGRPFMAEVRLPSNATETDCSLRVLAGDGRELIAYRPARRARGAVPPPATEPPAPRDVASADELFVTGLHLEQYRHATRSPADYWLEALRRDPLDARCNDAIGLWHLRRGEFGPAEACFRRAIARLTRRNANPQDGRPSYHLGLCLRHLGRDDEAYDAFYKATWNQACQAAAYHALAEIDCTRRRWSAAREHLSRALRLNAENLRARDLLAMVLRRLECRREAAALLAETLAMDPLDAWARWLEAGAFAGDVQTRLDLALDLARAGFDPEAIVLLETAPDAPPAPSRALRSRPAASKTGRALPPDARDWGASPLRAYYLGWLHARCGNDRQARAWFRRGARCAPDYCFPARLEEVAILEMAMRVNPADARAPYYLGNLLYDRRRHGEAIRHWEHAARLDPGFSVVWRNLGIGYYNIRRQPRRARAAYDRALAANPLDARLLYERDQLWKRLGVPPSRRLPELERRPERVRQRDDLSVELCALYNRTGQHARALTVLRSRRFQPWEGGEGGPFGQHVRAHLGLGKAALAAGDAAGAHTHFETALDAPANLGEAKHLLANQGEIHYWLGCARASLADPEGARIHWRAAATFQGDFQEMSARNWSEATYFSALACERLGNQARKTRLLRGLLDYARSLESAPAAIDYFATSLPTLLLFEGDLAFRQKTTALFLQAQAHLGLGRRARGRALLAAVLARDPNHALAADLWAELGARRAMARPRS